VPDEIPAHIGGTCYLFRFFFFYLAKFISEK
jgi:hypothetical protein